MTKVLPQDILANGTIVYHEMRGLCEVVSHEIHRDQHGQPITVHTLRDKQNVTKSASYAFLHIP